VEPAHPLVHEIFRPASRADGARAIVDRALEDLRAHFAYRGVRGRLGLTRLRELRAGGGGAPLDINCIDLSALLASQLRRGGLSDREVFVALCDIRWLQGRVRNDFHACVLVMAGGEMLWIPPEELSPVALRPDELLERYKLHVVFNDQHLYFTEAEKRGLLLRRAADGANEAGSGPKCFLYGRGSAETQALLDDPGFPRLIEACFRTGRLKDAEPGFAQRAAAQGLIAPAADGGGAWVPGPRMVLVPRTIERDFRTQVEPFLDRYVAIVRETLPALQQVYAGCSPAARVAWPAVCHTVVAGMLVDLSVGAQLHLAEGVRKTHGRNVVWVFESIAARNGFGVRWNGTPSSHCGVAQMWHVRVKQPRLRLEPRMAEVLARHACGEPVQSGPDVVYLRYIKLLRGGEITVPAFLPADTERLLEPLMAGAARIVREAILPALERFRWQDLQSGTDAVEGYRHSAVRLLLEYAIDRVVDAGLIPPFPEGEGVPPAWGTWLWIEPAHRPARLVPAGFQEAG
jgi:hypothetical protein